MKNVILKSILVLTLGTASLSALAQDRFSKEIERSISENSVPMQTMAQTERYTETRKALDVKLEQLSQAQNQQQFDELVQQSRDLAQQAIVYTKDLLVDMGDSRDNNRLQHDVYYKQYRLGQIIKTLDTAKKTSQVNLTVAQQLVKDIC